MPEWIKPSRRTNYRHSASRCNSPVERHTGSDRGAPGLPSHPDDPRCTSDHPIHRRRLGMDSIALQAPDYVRQ